MQMEKKINCFNKVTVRGYVQNFSVKTLASGTKLANVTIKNELDDNVTYCTMFARKGLTYAGNETTLEGLAKIFMGADDKPRHVLVEATGKVSESKGTDKDGNERTYVNTMIFSIEPYSDEAKQCAILSATGVVDAIKYGEDKDGEPLAKAKIGVMSYNRDKDITGVDTITVVAHGDMAEKLEEMDAEKGSVVSIRCDMVNSLGEVDRFGDRIGTPKKEIEVAKVVFVNAPDEIDEDEMNNYKKAKKLGRGEVIKVKKAKEEDDDLDDLDEESLGF